MRASTGVAKVFVANRLYVRAVTFDRMGEELNGYGDAVRAVPCGGTATLPSCRMVDHRPASDANRDVANRPTFSLSADKMGAP
jgi:hypothetical protein